AFISGSVAARVEKTATAANAITVSGRKIRMRPASPARLFKASEKITSVFLQTQDLTTENTEHAEK
ncbi:MAG: hypothetical protein DME62_16180, partial [Verrucomicrobia bacterium]